MQSSTLQKDTSPKPIVERLPIKVVIVLSELNDQPNEALQSIRKFCIDENLIVETRAYDSSRYNHDRDQISRLPAMHMYVKNIHQLTFYPNGRPIQIIQAAIEMYTTQQQQKLQNKGKWKRMLYGAMDAMRRIMHRKTRLEKQMEMDAAEARLRERRNSRSFRSTSMVDWD